MALILVASSILMAYTLALANSYGGLISELKRQVEKVSQAGSLGRGSGKRRQGPGGEQLPHLHLSFPLSQEARNKVFLAQRAVALSSDHGAL